jgi:hypothetical protein
LVDIVEDVWNHFYEMSKLMFMSDSVQSILVLFLIKGLSNVIRQSRSSSSIPTANFSAL